ncbi:MAG: glucosylglycerol hydrolase, partial [Cyanobacteria bacterium P01_G01_bin.4]
MPFGSVEPDTAGLPVGVSSAADSSLSAMPFVSSSASDSDDVVVSSTRFKTFAIALDLDATQVLADWARAVEASGETNFRKAQLLASRLGAHCRDDGSVSIGFWAPELAPGTTLHKDAYLEIFTPLEAVDFSQTSQT